MWEESVGNVQRKLDCYEIKKDWDNCCYHTFYAGIVKMTIRKPAQKIKEGSAAYHCKNNLFITEYGGRNKPPTQQCNGTATPLLIYHLLL